MPEDAKRIAIDAWERWMRHDGVADVEFYRRRSIVRMDEIDGDGARRERHGDDVGCAVRWRTDDGRIGFASASGESLSPTSVSIDSATPWPGEARPWGSVPEDDPGAPAGEADLDPPQGCAPTRLRVDRADRVEEWVADGAYCRRERHQIWTRVEFGTTEAPITASGFATPWRVLWEERRRMERPETDTQSRYLLLGPEPAARLAAALVAAEPGPRDSVGPGWVVEECPQASTSAVAPRFDDALHPAIATPLAAGGRWTGRLPERGSQRRAAFRDPPERRPWHLRVRPEIVEVPPHTATRMTGELRADGGGWAIGPWSFTPAEWLRRCVAGSGRDLATAVDVATPSLLFEL